MLTKHINQDTSVQDRFPNHGKHVGVCFIDFRMVQTAAISLSHHTDYIHGTENFRQSMNERHLHIMAILCQSQQTEVFQEVLVRENNMSGKT